jgi:Kdo2-lipid IVA lauroyltransferase/acyltransferase
VALLAIADRMPQRGLLAMGRLLGLFARTALVEARRIAEARTASSLPAKDARRVASESFVRAGTNLARCLLLRRPGVRALDAVRVTEQAKRMLAEALRGGKGVVFVSAHLGPFEAIAAAVAELGYEPAVVVRESYDPRLDAVVDAHRTRRGLTVIHRGSPHVGFTIMRALRAGKPVGFLPDLGARVPSVELTFMGEPVAFPVGPQVVSSRAAVPVLIGTLKPSREPGPAHELVLRRLDSDDDPVELTHRVAGALEEAILEAPEEWLWMSPTIRRLPSENSAR